MGGGGGRGGRPVHHSIDFSKHPKEIHNLFHFITERVAIITRKIYRQNFKQSILIKQTRKYNYENYMEVILIS